MRILFCFSGNSGHLEPLVPIAQVAVAAGHTVALAGRPWMRDKVESHGFAFFAAGTDVGLTPVRRPLMVASPEQEMQVFARAYGGRIAREQADDLLALCQQWQPDVLVCEETCFGGMIAAERLGLPYANVIVIGSGALFNAKTLREPLNAVRAAFDLPYDPDLQMVYNAPTFSPFSACYRDPRARLPCDTQFFRLYEPQQRRETPPWADHKHRGPLVYLTLGTVFNVESGDLFVRLVEGLRDLPIELLVTVGREIDPAELGDQPEHVQVERFIPQAEVLPYCQLVVSHAGSGSVLGALAHGLPMMLLPMGADQPMNGERCLALGVAQLLDPLHVRPAVVRATANLLLESVEYRLAAQQVAAELASFPPPSALIPQLEQLASVHSA